MVVPAPPLAVVRLRITLPETVTEPIDATIPDIERPLEVPTYALFQLLTVLFVMLMVVPPELTMPVMFATVALVEGLEKLMLLGVVRLPNVLPEMVTEVPAVLLMPKKLWETEAVPTTVMEPMVLFEIVTMPLLAAPIPMLSAPVVDVVTVTEPVPVAAPMVLPVMVPSPLAK